MKYLLGKGTTKFSKREYNLLKFNHEGQVSVTAARLAKIIDECIALLPNLPHDITVTDGTACCGGNVMSFMCHKRFKHVNAIEINAQTFELLCHNVNITRRLRHGTANVALINESYNHVMHKLKQDLVFLDPPWGIQEKNHPTRGPMDLHLEKTSIVKIVNQLHERRDTSGTRYVVLKVDIDFDVEKFKKLANDGISVTDFLDLCPERRRLFSFRVLLCTFDSANPYTVFFETPSSHFKDTANR